MKAFYWAGLGLLFGMLAGCSAELRELIHMDSSPGSLDLRDWNPKTDSPVILENWAWDPNVLWSPAEGRPGDLPPPLALGSVDRGGSFNRVLMKSFPSLQSGVLASATVHLTVLTENDQNWGLQIGVIPGAFKVWTNGILVWEQGVLSTDRNLYRAGGIGTVLAVQPQNGVLDIVVNIVTSDPLISHSEANRHWVLGPAEVMLASYQDENSFRVLQSTVVIMGILIFFWISTLNTRRRNFLIFIAFLASCLLKLCANVDQLDPFLNKIFPSSSLSLFLTHGLNLLPFPLLLLYFVWQFPEDVTFLSFIIFSIATALVSLWELLPFVLLACGWQDLYRAVLQPPWYFILNSYVFVAVLYFIETTYQLFVRKRPLSGAFFFGGLSLGLIILLPIPLSYFIVVKPAYFLGWGSLIFLSAVTFELVRLQLQTNKNKLESLTEELLRRDALSKFLVPEWASRLSRESLVTVRPEDGKFAESILVEIRSPDDAEIWLPLVGPLAVLRHALLVDWRDGMSLWALDSRSETALSFALAVQRRFLTLSSLRYQILLTKAMIRYHVLNLETQWIPVASDLPFVRLGELRERSRRYGVPFVLDATVTDGLAIGGWRRHRSLSVEGSEIEFYEAEEETMAKLKDKTLDSFESALGLARAGDFDGALQALFRVVKENPFDQVAKTFLSEWGTPRHGRP